MDHEPGREASEAEAVRLYLEAIEVPPLSWPAVEARARRLRAARLRVGPQSLAMPLGGALVAAALLVLIGGRVLAPVRAVPKAVPSAFASVLGGSAVVTGGPMQGAALSTTSSVRLAGRSYRVEAVPVRPDQIGRRLSGHGPARGAWQVPSALPKSYRRLDVFALYALKGVEPGTAIAVLGRFGTGPAMLWRAQAVPAAGAQHPAGP